MEGLTAITTALSGVKNASDIVKAIKESDYSLDKAILRNHIADLTNALADIRFELADVKAELIEKDSKIDDFKKRLKDKEDFRYEAPFMFKGNETIPYCAPCYQNSEKKINLIKRNHNDVWDCPACDKKFRGPNYIEPQIPNY